MRGTLSACAAIAFALPSFAAPTAPDSTCLPVIDLGYERHQALTYNDTTQVYKFQNIRYAQPPVGELRFRAPKAPRRDRGRVRSGSETRMCPQGAPAWQAKAYGPIAKYSNPNIEFDLKGWEQDILNSKVPSGDDQNKGADEDCLFLDVHVSKSVLQKAGRSAKGAPVLVWIHGGGYVLGSKNGHDPSGLLKHAREQPDEDMIFVALNYRLGALGFLAGPEVSRDGTVNAGILDQRMALEWVQENIHLFGGSKDHVTVMGESAGGGSILLHLTARGGNLSAPFQQAIPQSPAIAPVSKGSENNEGSFFRYLNVSSIKEAREACSKDVIAANAAHIGSAPTTTYIFGPVVDGDYVRENPARAVKEGRIDKSVPLLTGHNLFEGSFFFDPLVKTNEDFRMWLQRSMNVLTPKAIDHLANTLYPEEFDGSLGYVDQGSRQMRLWSEAVIDCHFDMLGQANQGKGYAYEFSVPPAFHIQDLTYTFNNPSSPARFPAAQDALQRAIVSFVQGGVPMAGQQPFPRVGRDRLLVNITSGGAGRPVASTVNATRCAWWATAFD